MRRFTDPGPDFEEFEPPPPGALRARMVAFYLPQFHAIPENDAWWGRGFTEWRNVARGVPRFAGHYQPRIPRDLGFYDLGDSDVMRHQAGLARAAGIEGFCFYYYRFDNGRLLEGPVERFLADQTIDMPFCLIWANENWTRTWDGFDRDVLASQSYDPGLEDGLIADLARHFADPRHIRVDGRPLFFIYRPGLIPDTAATIQRWRTRFEREHGENPFILMAQGFGDTDPRRFGLDGAVEFPPHKLAEGLPRVNDALQIFDPEFAGEVRRYSDLIRAARDVSDPGFPLIRTVVPSWDNEARRPGRGYTFAGSSPLAYRSWLDDAIAFANQHPFHGEPFVFVNAWNEWAEAAYLEPDVHYGSAYLNATARALHGIAEPLAK
jgi:lipopolysaccharide biosynthesis protein